MKFVQLTSLQGEGIIINADNICYIVKPGTGKGSKIFFNGLPTCLNIMEEPQKATDIILTQSMAEGSLTQSL